MDRRGKIDPLVGVVDAARTHEVAGNTGTLSGALLDHGDHDRPIPPADRAARPCLLGVDQGLGPLARPVISASCCSRSAIRRSRSSTGMALPPFLRRQRCQVPARRLTKCDEYSPSRRQRDRVAPSVAHASISWRMRGLYSPCTPAACGLLPPARRPPLLPRPAGPCVSFRLDPTVIFGSDCPGHPDTQAIPAATL
jgi:hypothetical protein